MKLLLVLGSDKTYNTLVKSFKPLGFDLIRYRHVQKAMDNIEEVDPQGIIVSAKDFPRHWKPLVSFVRSGRSKDVCPIVLLEGDSFPEEESNKARALEVNGLVPESLDDPAEMEKIQALLSQTAGDKQTTKDKPKTEGKQQTDTKQQAEKASGLKAAGLKAAASAILDSPGRFGFVFSNPEDEKIITGTVKTVSSTGFSFEPDNPDLAENLSPNTELANCSFRAGEDILSPSCTLLETGKTISLEFLSFPKGEKEQFRQYLGS